MSKKFTKSVNEFFLTLKARKCDFVACDSSNQMVFTKIKFPKDVIENLIKSGIKIRRRK